VAVFGDAVFDEDAGHAKRVEPVADFGAFDAPGEADVGPSGKDEGSGTRVLYGVGRVDGEAGLADVGDADRGPAGDHAIFVGSGVGFRTGKVRGLRITVRPEEERWMLGDSGDGEES